MALLKSCRSLANVFRVPVTGLHSARARRPNFLQRHWYTTKEEDEEEIGRKLVGEYSETATDDHTEDGHVSAPETEMEDHESAAEADDHESSQEPDDHESAPEMDEHEVHQEPAVAEQSLDQDTKYKKKAPAAFGDFGPGIYKGILLGSVGQTPVQKVFANNASLVIFSVGTGGLRNNRRQHEGENWEAYTERSFTQWHRVCVYKTGLQAFATKLKRGTNVYVEGNIETRVYNDPVTGVVKRIVELCVRQSGRLYVVDQQDASVNA